MQMLMIAQDQHDLQRDAQQRHQGRRHADANDDHQQRHSQQRGSETGHALDKGGGEGDEGDQKKLGWIHGVL